MYARLTALSATAFWAVTLCLFALGLGERDNSPDYFAFGCLTADLAVACTVLASLEHIVRRLVSQELAIGRRTLARGIAAAFADELASREETPPVRHLR